MTDPERLLASSATDFERLLLGAAARERPTSSQRRRLQRALGLSQVGVFLISAKALAGVASHSVVVAIVAASLAGNASAPKPIELPAQRAVSATHPRKLVAPTPVSSETQNTSRDPITAPVQPTPPTEAELPTARVSSSARTTNGPRKVPDLREEIALMDQARSALRNGAPSRTISALEQYRARFPHGSFGQEATVLRIEALEASGSHARAVAEAKWFLSRNPNSPHAERLRRIVNP